MNNPIEHLISFKDGSYKKIKNPVGWKHSQWIHYTLINGSTLSINPANVNYIEQLPINEPKE